MVVSVVFLQISRAEREKKRRLSLSNWRWGDVISVSDDTDSDDDLADSAISDVLRGQVPVQALHRLRRMWDDADDRRP